MGLVMGQPREIVTPRAARMESFGRCTVPKRARETGGESRWSAQLCPSVVERKSLKTVDGSHQAQLICRLSGGKEHWLTFLA